MNLVGCHTDSKVTAGEIDEFDGATCDDDTAWRTFPASSLSLSPSFVLSRMPPRWYSIRETCVRGSRAGINRDKSPVRAGERTAAEHVSHFHGNSESFVSNYYRFITVARRCCATLWQPLGRLPPCRTSAVRTSCESIGRPRDGPVETFSSST